MKIERDKWYVMRNGGKREVIKTGLPGQYPVLTIDADGLDIRRYTNDGRYSGEEEHPFDLISEHREPARVWVNFYPTACDCYETPGEAHFAAEQSGDATRIAVEFVEVVNGRDDG